MPPAAPASALRVPSSARTPTCSLAMNPTDNKGHARTLLIKLRNAPFSHDAVNWLDEAIDALK